MKNTVVSLNARQKSAILSVVTDGIKNGMTKKAVIVAACKKLLSMGIVDNSGDFNQMLSIVDAFYNMERARLDNVRPLEYLQHYAAFKMATMIQLSDYGAFGDLLECLARISSKPAALVTYNDIHVKRAGTVDITMRGVKFECGTNGKTFLESTEKEGTAGRYDKILYGVFDPAEKIAIMELVKNGEIDRAVATVQTMLYVFDKKQFADCMINKTGRGAMFQYKKSAGHWQVIYNSGKHTAFINMVDNENIPTLADWIASK